MDKIDLEITFEDLLRMQDEMDFEQSRRPGKKPTLFDKLPIEAFEKGFRLGGWNVRPKRFKEGGRTYWGFEFKHEF